MLNRLLAIVLCFSCLATQVDAAFISSKHKKDYSRISFNWESQVAYDLKQKGNLVTIKFKRSHPITKSQIDNQLKSDLMTLHSMTTGKDSLELTFELKKPGTALTLNNGGQVALDFVFDKMPAKEKEPEDGSDKEVKQDNIIRPATKPPALQTDNINMNVATEAVPAPPAPVNVVIEETVEGLRLIFDFPEASKAGAFLEASDLWLFFDKPVQFSWDDSILKGSQLITDMASYRSDKLVAVKLDMASEPKKASFYARGNQWILETTDLQGIVPVYIEPARADSSIVITDEHLGEPVFAQMPGNGNPRYFIPTGPGSPRVGRKHNFLDFNMQPTLLGAVIDPISQGLRVEKNDKNISVSRDGGLALSDNLDIASNRVRYQPPSLLNFSEWTSDAEDTAQNKRNYQVDIISTPKQARTPKRMELVRHYILTGRDYEARGLLEAARIYDPSLEKSPYYYSLLGLASFIAQKYDEALNYFESPVLTGDPEMAVWSELSKCQLRPMEVNFGVLGTGVRYFSRYPDFIKNTALLLASDAAVTQGKDNAVYLSLLSQDALTPMQKQHLEYLKVYAEAKAGKIPEAIAVLENYSQTMAPEFRLKSSLLLTQLKSDAKSITPEEEIKLLEKLRYKWTGDHNEYELWTRLADSYFKTKDYERALKLVRKGIRNYPKYATRDKLQQKGEKYFMDALADKDGDLLNLIGIFQEFDIFIPVDERRFKIQEELIDLLVKADLVDQAMGMMDKVIKDSSVKEEQKTRVRTRYGLLALLNDQPEKALTALNYTSGEVVPEDLAGQRRFLAAQANLMLGKNEMARELLKDDAGPAAFELVAQTFMDEKDWPNLVTHTQAYLRAQKAESGHVEPEAVLRLATAFQLMHKPEELKKLRDEYLELMAESPYKGAFELITAEDPTDFSSAGLKAELTKSQQLTKYLDEYREKVKKEGLSVL